MYDIDKLRRFWKSKIFEKDNFKCRACGDNNHLELAHITPIKTFVKIYGIKGIRWSFAWDNLVTLCHDCHNCYHRSKRGFNLIGWQYTRVRKVNKLFSMIKNSRNKNYWDYIDLGKFIINKDNEKEVEFKQIVSDRKSGEPLNIINEPLKSDKVEEVFLEDAV